MKVLVFPRDANPYQELLYAPMRKQGVTVAYLDGPTGSHTLNLLLCPVVLIARRLQGFTVFHLHWTYRFSLPFGGTWSKRLMQWYFTAFLWLVKTLGFRLVWTAHNVMPHAQRFANDAAARRTLIKQADAVIAHSEAAKEQLVQLGLQSRNVIVVPHGTYEGAYSGNHTRLQALRELGIPRDAFVVLFFGRIEHYKNVPALLQAAKELLPKNPRLHVVVAGSCKDPQITTILHKAKQHLGAHYHLYDRFIRDDEVQLLFAATDVAAIPFSEITTSGSALLALTFGVPLVVPRKGGMADIPLDVSYKYDSNKRAGLKDTLSGLMQADAGLTRKRAAARRYARKLSWSNIAERTIDLYGRL